MTKLKLTLLSWREYKARAPDADKNGVPDGGAFLHDWREVVAWRFYALLPFFGARLLAHEWWHATRRVGNAAHAPWYTFDVKCAHPFRLFDEDGLVRSSAEWRASALESEKHA